MILKISTHKNTLMHLLHGGLHRSTVPQYKSKQLVVSVSWRFAALAFLRRQWVLASVEWLRWHLWWPRTTQSQRRLLCWCWT